MGKFKIKMKNITQDTDYYNYKTIWYMLFNELRNPLTDELQVVLNSKIVFPLENQLAIQLFYILRSQL